MYRLSPCLTQRWHAEFPLEHFDVLLRSPVQACAHFLRRLYLETVEPRSHFASDTLALLLMFTCADPRTILLIH
jgi:hypothetical protein